MCSVSNKMWKKAILMWDLSTIKCVPIVSQLCTVASTGLEQENDKLLTKEKARTLVMNLTIEERDNLAWSLNHLESEETKAEYRGSVPTWAFFETVCMGSLFNT